jgi:hypothetical protein
MFPKPFPLDVSFFSWGQEHYLIKASHQYWFFFLFVFCFVLFWLKSLEHIWSIGSFLKENICHHDLNSTLSTGVHFPSSYCPQNLILHFDGPSPSIDLSVSLRNRKLLKDWNLETAWLFNLDKRDGIDYGVEEAIYGLKKYFSTWG